MRAQARMGRVTFALALAATVLLPAMPMAEDLIKGFPAQFSTQLAKNKEIYVATQRKDGRRATAVPVWFGVMDNAIWFTTSPGSHKARRVRHGSPVFVSVAGKDGPFVETKAEIIKDGALADRLGEIYKEKYWIAWLGFFRPSRARNESGKTILLRLTPE